MAGGLAADRACSIQAASAGEGRRLEDGAQRQLDREGVAHPRDELGGQQRVPAELEEAVLAADLLHSQHLAPEQGQGLVRRRCAAPWSAAAWRIGSGSGSAERSTLPWRVSGRESRSTKQAGTM